MKTSNPLHRFQLYRLLLPCLNTLHHHHERNAVNPLRHCAYTVPNTSFNIERFCNLPTVYLCVYLCGSYVSQNKQGYFLKLHDLVRLCNSDGVCFT
jgi:hypothetical protein